MSCNIEFNDTIYHLEKILSSKNKILTSKRNVLAGAKSYYLMGKNSIKPINNPKNCRLGGYYIGK